MIRRTPAGDAELAAPAHGLSLTQRRFLTLLDTPESIARLVRRHPLDPGRLDRDLARLAQAGLIACDAPSAPSDDTTALSAPVRLGAPRLARRLAFALLPLVAGVFAWGAWQHVSYPTSSGSRRPVPTTPAGKPEELAAASTAAEPAAIATRVLRGDPAEHPRDAARDSHAPGTRPTETKASRDAVPVSAAGPSQGRPREQGEAEARSARLRAWTAADTQSSHVAPERNEAARNSAPSGGSGAAKLQASGDHANASGNAPPSAAADKPSPAASGAAPLAIASTAGVGLETAIAPTAATPLVAPAPAPVPATTTTETIPSAPATSAPTTPAVSASAASETDSRVSPVAPIHVATAGPMRGVATPQLMPIARESPEFPREAVTLGIDNGRVKARLTIDAQGKVTRVDILEASHRAFDRAVRSALARWQFEPGAGGRTTTVDVAFRRD